MGYARLSTVDQDLGWQLEVLRSAGCSDERILRYRPLERTPPGRASRHAYGPEPPGIPCRSGGSIASGGRRRI